MSSAIRRKISDAVCTMHRRALTNDRANARQSRKILISWARRLNKAKAPRPDLPKHNMYMMPERLKLFKTGRTGQKPL